MKKQQLNLEILIASCVVILILAVGMIFYRFYDDLSWIDSFYFTTMTVTTVGLGDIAPTEPISRLFTSVYALISIPTILFCLGLIISKFIKTRIDAIENEVARVIDTEGTILEREEKILADEEEIKIP